MSNTCDIKPDFLIALDPILDKICAWYQLQLPTKIMYIFLTVQLPASHSLLIGYLIFLNTRDQPTRWMIG